MRKEYKFQNGVIYIHIPDIQSTNIHKATETFLKKVVEEKKRSNKVWPQ